MEKNNHLISVLRQHVDKQPNEILYRYIENENDEPLTLTYEQVDNEARAIASVLLQTCRKGERALMLYPPGLEFITAFLGCLYAGIIAVPAYPPRKNKKIDRLKSIIDDAQVSVVLTTRKSALIGRPLFKANEGLKNTPWLETDSEDINQAVVSNVGVMIDEDDIAFLQYTSGSTGNPKGVVVDHKNIMSNMAVFYQSFGHNAQSKGVSWLPHFHDMGLIGGVLQPLYGGFSVTLMAPTYFLQKPIRWLDAISKYGATSSGGPNFSYDLCVDRIKDEELEGVDLSNWQVAPNGSESVHAKTLARFSEKFAKCGFNSKNHYPCYGMAESTLMISGGARDKAPTVININIRDLEKGMVSVVQAGFGVSKEIVSCGHCWINHEIVIVNPDSLSLSGINQVGEIWVKGESIAKGYWNDLDRTENTFHAFINDTKEGPYLRTGDLGFIYEGELFVCGRLKNLLIIRGRNFYPQDIEIVSAQSHEALSGNSTAVFSVEIGGQEEVVILLEVKRTHLRNIDPESIFETIKESVSDNFELYVHDIVLLKPARLLRTSSGKMQHLSNKEAYENKSLEYITSLQDTKRSNIKNVLKKSELDLRRDILKTSDRNARLKLINGWLIETIETLGKIQIEPSGVDKSCMALGVDSLVMVQLQSAICDEFGLEFPLAWLYEFPTIELIGSKINTLFCSQKDESYHSIQKNKVSSPLIEQDPDTQYEPFVLNDIQQAYLLGRSADLVLGNTACYAYTEIESRNIDIDRLEVAWNKLIVRHGMLRCVVNDDGTQQISETSPVYKVKQKDISTLDKKELEDFLLDERRLRLNKVLDTKKWPLFSLKTYLLPDNKKLILFYIDMLICDASSVFILLNELHHYYDNPETPLPALDLSFKDYIHYEEEYKEGDLYKRGWAYWEARLTSLPGGPDLPLAVKPSTINSPIFERRTYHLSVSKWEIIQEKAAKLRITPTVILLGLFSRVMASWSSSPHFCINLTLFNRIQAHEQINQIVGDFTSLIPLEVNATPEKSLSLILEEIQKQLLDDLEHRDVGGVRILRELRSIGRESVMPVVFTSTLGLEENLDISWLGKKVYSLSQTPQVWIDNQVSKEEGKLIINWDCIEGLFEEKMLSNMFSAYTTLIESLVESDAILTSERLSLIPQEQLVTRKKYNHTQHHLLQEVLPLQCMKRAFLQPDEEAVITSQIRLNYRQLHNASAQIAAYIESTNPKDRVHVAIILPKGWEQIASVLSAGYAGVAYLPVATDLPQERITYLLDEVNIALVLSDKKMLEALDLAESIQAVDIADLVDIHRDMHPYTIKSKAKELAYTIFTSGSTGKPKGVMINHENVCNTVMDINERFGIGSEDKIFSISALNFDLSVFDIYGALSAGASIVMPDENERRDAKAWLQWLINEQVSVWNSVPALVNLLCVEASNQQVELPPDLRLILMSGDFIPPVLCKEIEVLSTTCEVISLGGATEGSIWSIYYPVKDMSENVDKVPYGYPLYNQEIHILDSNLQPRPDGVQGDIYITGKGVAQGYFNDIERTEEQFLVEPLTQEVFYKTGDIGYFNAKGYVEILGREDSQVKIQGYRIELGEIEQALSSFEKIDSVAVVVQEINNIKHLVAYVTEEKPQLEADPEAVELGAPNISKKLELYLKKTLPVYMVPSYFISLNTLPLNVNGKIDRQELANRKIHLQATGMYVEPRNETEDKLAQIFAEVLNTEKVGINDNFFELGGHSLLATQLLSKIRENTGVELPLSVIFEYGTVVDISNIIYSFESHEDTDSVEFEEGTL